MLSGRGSSSLRKRPEHETEAMVARRKAEMNEVRILIYFSFFFSS